MTHVIIRNCILVTMLSIGTINYGMQFNDQTESLDIISWNIDVNSAKTEEGYARDSHPQWRIQARMPKIIQELQKQIDEREKAGQKRPAVIMLQEGRQWVTKFDDKVDAITPLVEFLSHSGYTVKIKPYNPSSDKSMIFITAIRDDFTVGNEEQLFHTNSIDPITKKPTYQPTDHTNHAVRMAEIKELNQGEEWERSLHIVPFSNANGQQYEAINVHFGLVLTHRLAASKQLKDILNNRIAANPKVKRFAAGDFNTLYPNGGGPEQIEILKECKADEVSSLLFLRNGKLTTNSFIACPYDWVSSKDLRSIIAELIAMNPQDRKKKIGEIFGQNHCRALCGQLDHIYAYGFRQVCSNATLIPTPQFLDDWNLDYMNDEQAMKDYILRHHDDGPAFASDHQMMTANLVPDESDLYDEPFIWGGEPYYFKKQKNDDDSQSENISNK